MSRTVVLGFATRADADAQANNYKDDYRVMVIGPTDQVGFARGDGDMTVWRSGQEAEIHLMIATKDDIAGPSAKPGGS